MKISFFPKTAEACLTFAFENSSPYPTSPNKRKVLIYLVPVKMFLVGYSFIIITEVFMGHPHTWVQLFRDTCQQRRHWQSTISVSSWKWPWLSVSGTCVILTLPFKNMRKCSSRMASISSWRNSGCSSFGTCLKKCKFNEGWQSNKMEFNPASLLMCSSLRRQPQNNSHLAHFM